MDITSQSGRINIMTKVYATLSIDDIDATLSATATQDSYGVQGSPTWLTLEDGKVESLEILGVKVDPATLPGKLIYTILDLADEWLEESDWQAMD